MPTTIYTVALHPAIDVTLWLDRLDPASAAVPRREQIDPAGKAVNAARVLHSLGVPYRLFGLLGSGNGGRFRALLEDCGVRGEFLELPGFVRENLSLVAGDALYKVDRKGLAVCPAALSRLGERLRRALAGEERPLILFAGSLPPGVTPGAYREFIRPFREAGARVVLDSAFWTPEDLRLIRPFAIKPNREEFCRLIGRELSDIGGVFSAAEDLSGAVEHMLVSLGGEGIAYLGGGRRLYAQVPEVRVRSCVGAGDSALAGFLAALETGRELEACIRFAAACGTAAVAVEGTGVLRREDALELFPEIRLEEWDRAEEPDTGPARRQFTNCSLKFTT